jgi:adenine deaminase
MLFRANIVDIKNRDIYPAEIETQQKKIISIKKIDKKLDTYILPGFIDAHIHIESSMLPPTHFASLAVTHGSVATISDPHEIANVLGIKGVEYMIENAKSSPFKFYFGASPCVPATPFETSGATLGVKEI